ncbi:hypothetical protein [Streptomyces sp. NPDC012825]|uniref:hypothetical protein n=1 Tax=Streptomyces sp. NPDC012825 TaxID=3364851 RepID=UPI003694B258
MPDNGTAAVAYWGDVEVKFSPRVRLVGNVVGTVLWLVAGYVMATDSAGFFSTWLMWVVGLGVATGLLCTLRGIYLAHQEQKAAR